MTRSSPLVWHPLLFALYPILLLYNRSSSSVFFAETLAAIFSTLALTSLGWLILGRIWHDATRAGLTISVLLFLGFSFERNVYWLKGRGWIGSPAAREWVVLLVETLGLVTWVWFVQRQPRFVRPLQTTANAASVVLLLFLVPSLIETGRMPLDRPEPVARTQQGELHPEPLARLPSGAKPDIYFIVLDAYGRSDVLRSLLGFDNQAWLRRMQQRGFFLARASNANYCQTALSVTATLNAAYHDELTGSRSYSRLPLRESLQNSRFPRFLRAGGYKLVSFATGFGLTDGFPADERWGPPLNLSEFNGLVLDMTPLWTILGSGTGLASHQRHRERILYAFDRIAQVAVDPQPTFCLVHLVAPHPPFVFARDGSDLSRESAAYRLTDGLPWGEIEGHGDPADYARHYADQAAYISARIETAVDQILARSPRPPIIIIQGDHGPGSHFDPDQALPNDLFERMGILNLILAPAACRERFYATMTPVNTFRILSDTLFGTQLGLLPDRSYHSSYQTPYQLTDVTAELEVSEPQSNTASPTPSAL